MKFVLPEPKETSSEKGEPLGPDEYDDFEWRRRVTVPVSKEMVAKLSVGDKVKAVLDAEIVGLESRERESGTDMYELELDLRSVTTEGKNEFSELVEDE